MKYSVKTFLSLLMVFTILNGCKSSKSSTTYQNNKKTIIGAGTGVLLGGALGALLGKKSGNPAGAVIIGAAVGGVAGGAIGRYMDNQTNELKKDMKDAKIEREGEGIKITFNSGILFDINSDKLSAQSEDNLKTLAKTLSKYNDTNVLIDGYTDNTGTAEFNQKLSEKRANAVHNYLIAQGVKSERLGTRGFGSLNPVSENTSEAGRTANRRVEVAIWANDKLKKAAQRGDLPMSK